MPREEVGGVRLTLIALLEGHLPEKPGTGKATCEVSDMCDKKARPMKPS